MSAARPPRAGAARALGATVVLIVAVICAPVILVATLMQAGGTRRS